MKKGLKILCAALSLTAIMSFSAFAAETRKEYRAEAEPIRTEMKAMEEQMDALRESNKNSMEHFKNIHLNKKETGELPVDKSVWKEAKTLRGKIKTIREENGDSQVKNLRAEAKAAAENKDFDTAILKLKEAEKEKEKRLEMLKEINSIWKQIDNGNGNDYIHFHLRRADGSYLSVLDHGRIVESQQYGKVFYVLFMDWEDMKSHYSEKFSG